MVEVGGGCGGCWEDARPIERDGQKDNKVTCIPSGVVIGQNAPYCVYFVGDLGSYVLLYLYLDGCKAKDEAFLKYSYLNILNVDLFSWGV